MEFLQWQIDLHDLTMDDSVDWIAGWDKNKKAYNKGYEMIFDSYKNYSKVKKRIATAKVQINFTNKVADLPADFDTENIVSIFDFATDSDIDTLSDGRYYDFEVRGMRWAKKMYIEWYESILYVSYIPIREDLDIDTDIPNLPEELHPCIADFAYYWYNRMIRDTMEASTAIQLAQSNIETKLASLW